MASIVLGQDVPSLSVLWRRNSASSVASATMVFVDIQTPIYL